MTPQAYALWTGIHGHVAVLGLAVLLHPVVSLWRRGVLTPWGRRTAYLGAALLALPYALGWWLYPTYRTEVKPGLFERAPDAMWRFESKEHLAAICVALAVGGALVVAAAHRDPAARRVAWWLFATSWIAGAITAGLGLYVRSVAQPGW